MKGTTKMSRAICQLEKMYNTINSDKFNGELPECIITVQSKAGSMGHSTTKKVWSRQKTGDGLYELNIEASVLNYPIEETVDTMIHEMVHIYCRVNEIKETSRGNGYHNKRFKELAEKVGLKCIYFKSIGWNTTPEGNDSLIEYILEKGWNEIQIGRNDSNIGISPIVIQLPGEKGIESTQSNGTSGGKATSSTRKYQCPKCKNSVRATKDLHIICGDCMIKMEKVEKE